MSDSPPLADATQEPTQNAGVDLGSRVAIRNEGQRLLLAVPGPASAIAEAIGGRTNRVGDWRRGTRTPPAPMRAALFAHYQIPVDAWATPDPSTQETEGPPASAPTLEIINDRLGSLARRRPGLTGNDLAKLEATEARLLGLRAKLEGDALSMEARIVRDHPAFRRATEALVAALTPWPDAAHAAALALAELDDEPRTYEPGADSDEDAP